ncbi:uncharacterized protein N7446_007451 [Penicillium canescens]|uniref:uncharacterized protein n=1 Tax=Penicillium canescens TaxID=5083 RepID=UPI0026E06AAF|nr:uncharacterized protein N7446_007451 [Penicillium canescens]KAJ6063331.1 hypothetical protein N7446_007451 [Penicillium canescens]
MKVCAGTWRSCAWGSAGEVAVWLVQGGVRDYVMEAGETTTVYFELDTSAVSSLEITVAVMATYRLKA